LWQVGQILGSANIEGGGVGEKALVTEDATNVAALVITSEVGWCSPLDWGCGKFGPDPIAPPAYRDLAPAGDSKRVASNPFRF